MIPQQLGDGQQMKPSGTTGNRLGPQAPIQKLGNKHSEQENEKAAGKWKQETLNS